MKKLVLGIAFAAMAVFASCAQRPDPALNGTWVVIGGVEDMMGILGEIEWIFDDGNFENWTFGLQVQKGTYTTSNGTITMKVSHVDWTGGVVGLLDQAGLKEFIIAEEGHISEELEELIDMVFAPSTSTYTVSDNIFTLTSTVDGETSTLTLRRVE